MTRVRRSPQRSGARRVQFIHGLEGSPNGAKARLLAAHFEALTPAMDTRDFEACVRVQADAIAVHEPELLIGSSFGAAVAVELLQRGLWKGPTLLLAQAALRRDPAARLPDAVPVWLVHGLRDELIDPEDSRKLAATGSLEQVRLFEVDDDHALRASVKDGALLRFVEALLAAGGTAGDERR